MKLNELAPSPGAKKVRRRLGRGLGSGRGKTAGRGQKGQKSRSGYSKKAGWEGGRSRLIARLPKRGFTGKGEDFQVVNLSDLNAFEAGTTVTVELLRQHGLVRKVRQPVKLLGGGELAVSSLRVEVDAYSASAVKAIQAAGGSVVGVKENA
ncbi:MAG: 50S ribosomal protein L15 [Truepera sp.]|nr:50S ribosomal protein L15 [Truepera sp.]